MSTAPNRPDGIDVAQHARPRLRRLGAVLAGLLAAIVLVFIGQLFGLNGQQWDWWRSACFAGAAALVAVVLVHPILNRAARRVPRLRLLALGALGLGLVASSLAAMSVRYSDPYAGPQLWPHLLALGGLLGFVIVSVAVSALVANDG